MLILENEIKKIEECQSQLDLIKECLWRGKIKRRDRELKKRAIKK